MAYFFARIGAVVGMRGRRALACIMRRFDRYAVNAAALA
jgi:hypothetical protein